MFKSKNIRFVSSRIVNPIISNNNNITCKKKKKKVHSTPRD